MSKNQKKLYIGIFIAILFAAFAAFSATWTPDVQVVQVETPTVTNTESVLPSPVVENQAEKISDTKTENPKIVEENTEETTRANTESVTVLAGEATVHLSFLPNTLFYDALVEARNKGQISFEGKNYPSLGFFVTDIGTLHAGDGKYLLYYINGKEATVGVSMYALKDGDVIEWKLE